MWIANSSQLTRKGQDRLLRWLNGYRYTLLKSCVVSNVSDGACIASVDSRIQRLAWREALNHLPGDLNSRAVVGIPANVAPLSKYGLLTGRRGLEQPKAADSNNNYCGVLCLAGGISVLEQVTEVVELPQTDRWLWMILVC